MIFVELKHRHSEVAVTINVDDISSISPSSQGSVIYLRSRMDNATIHADIAYRDLVALLRTSISVISHG
jgi:hypothetical protein